MLDISFSCDLVISRNDHTSSMRLVYCFELSSMLSASLAVLARLSCALPLALHDIGFAATPCSQVAS